MLTSEDANIAKKSLLWIAWVWAIAWLVFAAEHWDHWIVDMIVPHVEWHWSSLWNSWNQWFHSSHASHASHASHSSSGDSGGDDDDDDA